MKFENFIDQYNKDHAVCPICGSKPYSRTLVGYLFDEEHPENYKDNNLVECSVCGWKGVTHDLIKE